MIINYRNFYLHNLSYNKQFTIVILWSNNYLETKIKVVKNQLTNSK